MKKKLLAEIFCIFECLLTQNPTNQGSQVYSSRSYGRLLENQKEGGSRDIFLPENDFQTSSVINFQEKHPDFGSLETNQRHEIQT